MVCKDLNLCKTFMKSYSIFKNCLYRVVFLYKVYKILCQMHGLSVWRFYYSFILRTKN